MEQTYVLYAPTSTRRHRDEDDEDVDSGSEEEEEPVKESERSTNAAFRIGRFLHRGYIDIDESTRPMPVTEVLPLFQKHQHRLPLYCERQDLPESSRLYETLACVERIVKVAVRVLTNGIDEELAKLQKCDMLDAVDDDLSNAHFEFTLRPEAIKELRNVEVLLHKSFLAGGAVRFNAVYVEGSFHVILRSGEGAHNLSDATFPSLQEHGDGHDLRRYDEDDDDDDDDAAHTFKELRVYGDFIREKDAAARKSADIDDAPAAEDAHRVERALSGYNQTYVIHKQPPHTPESPFRSIFFRCGNFCYAGNLDMGVSRPSLGALPSIVPTLQTQQNKLNYVGTIGDLISFSRWEETLQTLESSAAFLLEKMTDDETAEAIEYAGNEKWRTGGTAFFELQTEADMPGLHDVEMLATKTYMKELILILLYFEGSWYAHLKSAKESSQPLLDTDFPDLTARGRGLCLGTYDDHKYFLQLYLWDGHVEESSEDERERRRVARKISDEDEDDDTITGKKMKKMSLKDYNDYEDYTQTYVIMRAIGAAEGQSSTRETIFRYGNWCYAGRIEMGTTRLNLEDLINVIPILQLQQSNLAYMCKKGDVPPSSRFHSPMVQMTEAAQYLGDRICEAADDIEDLAKHDPEGYGWLLENDGNTYFQLRTDNHHVTPDVEYMSSKTVVRGVQMCIVYFGGSYYVQLTDAEGHHSLLNTRFPDVTWRARGHHFADRRYVGNPDKPVDISHFRGLSVWEGTPPSVKEELKEKLCEVFGGSSSEEEEDQANASASSKTAQVDDDREMVQIEAKVRDDVEKRMKTLEDMSLRKEKEAEATSPKKTKKSDAAAFKVRAPHHLAPLTKKRPGKKSVGADPFRASRMKLERILGKSSGGPAPWERGGRPLVLKKLK